jgi:hypothetical protein
MRRTTRHPSGCSIGSVLRLPQSRSSRIYENLPAPTYSQFVIRSEPFEEVIDGLQQRSAVVLIVGLGGNGKTSLAREVAACCLQDNHGLPRFDAAVWMSDKDKPGTINFSVVLDEIARTLDYPGFTHFEHEEKRREVEQLLRRQRVLLVIDNFETINDGGLLSWLLRLPEPSKAIITTREYRREFRRSSWPVDLRGMTEAEALELITERVKVLKIEKLIGNPARLSPLLAATGCNPKAIEMTMGLLKYEHRSIQQIVDDLYAARGELFDDLFTRAWALLDEAARRLLLSATFFPASVSAATLSTTAGVADIVLKNPIDRLIDLALLDVQQISADNSPRYTLHPLVRAFARARLIEQDGFEDAARLRWKNSYLDRTMKSEVRWEDLGSLTWLDLESETTEAVILWLINQRCYTESIRMLKVLGYYYNVRGMWSKKYAVDIMRLEIARVLKDGHEEISALAYLVQSLVRHENQSAALLYMEQLRQVTKNRDVTGDLFSACNHAYGMYSLLFDQDADRAIQMWQASMERKNELSERSSIINRQWIAVCLKKKGDLSEARHLLEESLHDAERLGLQRSKIFNLRHLAEIALTLSAEQTAEETLVEGLKKAREYYEWGILPILLRLQSRLLTLRGQDHDARKALEEAIDLSERQGMRRDLAEAHAALEQLEKQALSASHGSI